MHLVQEYISTPVATGSFIVVAGFATALVTRKNKSESLSERASSVFTQKAFITILAVFGLIGLHQMNYATPLGYSGHLLGAGLLAYYLGFRRSFIAMGCSLALQAWWLGDGDFYSLGANILNMGVVVPAVFLLVQRKMAKESRVIFASILSLYAGITVMSMMTLLSGSTTIGLVANAYGYYLPIALIEAMATVCFVLAVHAPSKTNHSLYRYGLGAVAAALFVILVSLSVEQGDVLSSLLSV